MVWSCFAMCTAAKVRQSHMNKYDILLRLIRELYYCI